MRRTLLVLLLLCLLLPLAHAEPGYYAVTDLGAWSPVAINNAAQVAGTRKDAQGRERAVLWERGTLTELPTLPGGQASALGLNDAGEVVGWSQRGIGVPSEGYRVPALWKGGEVIQLPWAGRDFNEARAINNQGMIVGWTNEYDLPPLAALWAPGAPSFLFLANSGTSPDVQSVATAVNNHNVAVGFVETMTEWRATVWENGAARLLPNRAGILNLTVNAANDINDAGTVVGQSGGFPVRWPREGGVMVLRNGPGAALAVNGTGVIVGKVNSLGAFRWNRETGLQNLANWIPSRSGWVLTEARDINDSGAIIGMGTYRGQTRGFLLTPTLNGRFRAMR